SRPSSERYGYGKRSSCQLSPHLERVHSKTLPAMSQTPSGLTPAGKWETGLVPPSPASAVFARPVSNLSPQGKTRALSLPRAAYSHSASVGSRKPGPSHSHNHAQKAAASYHDTPTTG